MNAALQDATLSESAFRPLTLPNGAVIPNRIAKAATEEALADAERGPSAELRQLYQTWAEGGAGLLITGNVMIDRRALTGPGAVVLEDDRQLGKFRDWARAGRSRGAQFWMQISHPGRQVFANMGQEALAPSAVPLDLGGLSKLFAMPRAMTEQEIAGVVRRFVRTAQLAEQAGFTGVQIHAAHGYLLSQFLSPLTNLRGDEWGGSLENRSRLLLSVIKAIRTAVSRQFCVAVKLNSADFQRGGFAPEDASHVVQMLNEPSVDLVELSGGNYEAPAMHGDARDGRTLAREAYFLEFVSDVTRTARMPIMLTGGIRRLEVLRQVLDSGVAVAGMASALALNPNLPREWQAGKSVYASLRPIRWRAKGLAALASMARMRFQLRRMGHGRAPQPSVSPLRALLVDQLLMLRRTREYRRWMHSR